MRRAAWIWATVLAGGLSVQLVGAQDEGNPLPGDTLGWHVVRPGDTLEEITRYYLGAPQLWPENWRLNPHITNPHLLRIGDRLRIITRRQLPPRTAEVLRVERRVEEKPHPNEWMAASAGDLLREQDGLRTHRRSSAELAFDDGTTVVLTENSLVFLREVSRSLSGTTRETIEVVQGQADLASSPRRADDTDIEVIVGQVRAEPRPGSTGSSSSRLRRPPDGGAHLMVYGGTTRVESAGVQLEVPAGMGTAVPEGEAPPPPERLLPAPAPLEPRRDSAVGFATPVLIWQAVEGAAGYTVEVCWDAACSRLVDRHAQCSGTRVAAGPLPMGRLHWRVTAVSSSGLDGVPSRGVPFEVTSDRPDLEPPVVVLLTERPARSAVEGELVVATEERFRLVARDDASGVAMVRLRWNDGPWIASDGGWLAFPDSEGRHELEFTASDHAGRESRVWRVIVHTDAGRPAPPAVRVLEE